MTISLRQFIASVLVLVMFLSVNTNTLAASSNVNDKNTIEVEHSVLTEEEIQTYLATGEFMTPFARPVLVALGRQLFKKAVEVIAVQIVSDGYKFVKGWLTSEIKNGNSSEQITVNYVTFNPNHYTTWACDTCVNSSFYVDLLQRSLTSLSFSTGGVDGYWGPKTKSGLISFQRAAGIKQDGDAGPATWGKLAFRSY